MGNPSFRELVLALSLFKMKCVPINETEIEDGIEVFLKEKGFSVKRQVSTHRLASKKGRFDLTVGSFIIETKMIAQKKVVEQLDRYSCFCQGLILLCWKATKPIKMIFNIAESKSTIPIALIEVSKNCDMV